MDREDLVEMMEQNEYDYHVLPHYGLMSDWFVRYWDLHNAVYSYVTGDTTKRSDMAGIELPDG